MHIPVSIGSRCPAYHPCSNLDERDEIQSLDDVRSYLLSLMSLLLMLLMLLLLLLLLLLSLLFDQRGSVVVWHRYKREGPHLRVPLQLHYSAADPDVPFFFVGFSIIIICLFSLLSFPFFLLLSNLHVFG